MKNKITASYHLSFLAAIFFISCSNDGDPKVTLDNAPEIKRATEVAANSFVANWEKVKGANYYKVEVSENIEFTLPVEDCFGIEINGASLLVAGLTNSKKYFYRVKAGNESGETDYPKVMSVRSIDKESLYDILWNGDAQKSNVSFLLQDLYFHSNGNYSGYTANTPVSSGTYTIIKIKTSGITKIYI